jgi:hypothetical protein
MLFLLEYRKPKKHSRTTRMEYVIRKMGKERKSTQIIQIPFDEFLEFIYPTYEK